MSRVIDSANTFRRRLLNEELVAMREMAEQWRAIQLRLESAVQAVVDEIFRLNQPAIPIHNLWQIDRYRELMLQIERELSKYRQFVESSTLERRQSIAFQAYEDYEHLIRASLQIPSSEGYGLRGVFNKMSPQAVEKIVGMSIQGPLQEVLQNASAIGAERMTELLAQGIALGRNPRQVAYDMIHLGLGQSFTRFATIARTEMLRTYREVTLEGFRQSGIVEGYVRVATMSLRTCISCLVLDGRVYNLNQEFESHPNCRCFLVPIGSMLSDPPAPRGRVYFDSLSEANKRAIMGPGIYDMYSRGEILWDNLVRIDDHPDWGPTVSARSYRELQSFRASEF